jgi:hypothetical protein
MEETKEVYRILVCTSLGKLTGKLQRMYKDNISMNLMELNDCCVFWVGLTEAGLDLALDFCVSGFERSVSNVSHIGWLSDYLDRN